MIKQVLKNKWRLENATVHIEPFDTRDFKFIAEFPSEILIKSMETWIQEEEKKLKDFNNQLEAL